MRFNWNANFFASISFLFFRICIGILKLLKKYFFLFQVTFLFSLPSMFFLARVGCVLILYGPYFIVGSAIFKSKPQLLLIWLGTVIWAYVTAYWMTSLLFSSIYSIKINDVEPVLSGKSDNSNMLWMPWCIAPFTFTPKYFSFFNFRVKWTKITIFIFQQTIQFGSKTFLFLLLLYFDSALRRDNQVLLRSSFRFVPVGATVGLGFAAASLLVSSGFLLDSELQLVGLQSTGNFFPSIMSSPSYWMAARSVTAYDFFVCPQLPVVIHRSIESFLFSIASMTWSIIHSSAVVAFYNLYSQRNDFENPTNLSLRKTLFNSVKITECRTISPNFLQERLDCSFSTSQNKNALYHKPKLLCFRHKKLVSSSSDPNADNRSKEVPSHFFYSEKSLRSVENDDCRKEQSIDFGRNTRKCALRGEKQQITGSDSSTTVFCGLDEDNRVAYDCDERISAEESRNDSTTKKSTHESSSRLQLNQRHIRQKYAVFPENSVFSQLSIIYSYVALFLAFFFPFCFSFVTLGNRSGLPSSTGAYLCSSLQIIPQRGCVFSLSFQLMITSISLLTALLITRAEYRPFYCFESFGS